MKKQLIFLVAVFATFWSSGQTDELNLQKYWKFRSQFVQKFVKVGPENGESFPAGVLSPYTHCYDAVAGDQKGAMFWGDGGVRHGHYLTLLATEYALLKKNNQDTEGVLNELYFALNALNRVDGAAEQNLELNYGLTGFYPLNDINGYYLREDIPEDFCLNWETDDLNPKCIYSPNYTNNNVQKQHNGSGLVTTPNSSYQNTPSVDQMISILLGIRMIHKLVDDVQVQPTSGDTPMLIVTEAVAIADRMIKYAADHNWFLIDVNGWPVNSNGGDLSVSSYPLVKTWEALHNGASFPYNEVIKRRSLPYVNAQFCITGFGVNSTDLADKLNACESLQNATGSLVYNALIYGENAGILNNQNSSVFQDWQLNGTEISDVNYLLLPWTTTLPSNFALNIAEPYNWLLSAQETYDLNVKLSFYLATIGGVWPTSSVYEFANETKNYELEMADALLKDVFPQRSQFFYKAMLDNLSPTGPFSLDQVYPYPSEQYRVLEYQSGGWASEYRWIDDNDFGSSNGRQGIYSALDYMVLHNLYYLLYDNQLPEFKEDYQCFCEPTVQVQPTDNTANAIDQAIYLNDKLAILPTCEEHVFMDNVVTTGESPFLVNPYFNDYADLKISTAKFNMENTTIADGALVEVNSNLIICNATTLTGVLGSSLVLNKADVRINDQATLDFYGDIVVKDGTSLIVKEGAKLILRNGSELRIKEGGKLIIHGEVQYYDGASIITEYDNAEIELNGTIKMMDGGTFTCGNTPGQPTGRLVVNSPDAKFSKAMNAGYCAVHLKGQDDTDELLVLKQDAQLSFMHNPQININKLTISACKVSMEENTRIEARQELNTYNAQYIATEVNQGIHVARNNQFNGVDFQNVNIHANLNMLFGHKLRMSSCNMTNLSNGTNPNEPMVHVKGTGMVINNCTFVGDNETYILAENLTFPSIVSASTFDGSEGSTSIGIDDHSNAELTAYQNTFNSMHIGIRKHNDPVTAKCNTFNENRHSDIGGIYGSQVNLTTDDYGGYNSFNSEDASHGNIWLWYGDVTLNNGRNYFNPASDRHLYARMDYPCPFGLNCVINADNNQWNTGTQAPASSKFDVVGSDQSPINVEIMATEVLPTCGFYDGQYTTGSGILPNVSSSLGVLPLDKTIHFARQEMTLNDTTANDEDALKLLDEVFRANVPLDSAVTRKWMYAALADMKTALESEYYMQYVLQESGQNPVMTYVDNYLNALNYMTPDTITAENYRTAFHLELDKVQLYRMLEMPEDAREILEYTELCGLDSLEQEAVNYWKEQVAYDILIDQMGMDILDTTIVINTKNYKRPVANPAGSFSFGTTFNSLSSRTYAACSNGNRIASDENKLTAIQFMVYPVPADEVINITIQSEKGLVLDKILLYDAMGRMMGEIVLSEGQTHIRDYSIANWSTGVYFFNVYGPQGSLGGGRFVVE